MDQMNDGKTYSHGQRDGGKRYCSKHGKWGSASYFSRDHGNCGNAQPQSKVTDDIDYAKIHGFLLEKFGETGYDEDEDKLEFCPSLDEAKRMFETCTLYKLTGCWTYGGTEARYRTVAHWICNMNRMFRFRLQNGTYITQSESSLLVRHHPLRCELMRTTPSQHMACCRPSHLRWGTSKMNSDDKQLRQDVEQHEQYSSITRTYLDCVDKLAKTILDTSFTSDEAKVDTPRKKHRSARQSVHALVD